MSSLALNNLTEIFISLKVIYFIPDWYGQTKLLINLTQSHNKYGCFNNKYKQLLTLFNSQSVLPLKNLYKLIKKNKARCALSSVFVASKTCITENPINRKINPCHV